jgi:hypothetical protein
MKILLFEGTTEEYRQVADLFRGNTTHKSDDTGKEGSEVSTEGAEERHQVSVDQATQILKRIPLSDNVRAVLKYLADAKEEVSSEYLREKIVELSGDQFRGMMGAFGRRVINTFPGQKLSFFEKRWNGDEYYWSLTDNAKQAVRQINLS